ncbi:BURP domain-containing protein 16-like [Cryptomeria japonica]|uniref:BURP domain-containing protein 16-like n=1 Tax=Cryptomeria japonica TaxID=3369 RepID=UPI0027DA8586|nr:BURP domain-containing protein 16-like [Cryptomeria japonica]
MAWTLRQCERVAMKDENKKCVRSVEGMAEFSVLMLGSKVEIRKAKFLSASSWAKTATLFSMKEEKKINEGVAIYQLDTSQWSAGHAAFVALGHQPGENEVCHWIFKNDLIWVSLPA